MPTADAPAGSGGQLSETLKDKPAFSLAGFVGDRTSASRASGQNTTRGQTGGANARRPLFGFTSVSPTSHGFNASVSVVGDATGPVEREGSVEPAAVDGATGDGASGGAMSDGDSETGEANRAVPTRRRGFAPSWLSREPTRERGDESRPAPSLFGFSMSTAATSDRPASTSTADVGGSDQASLPPGPDTRSSPQRARKRTFGE